MFRSQTKLFGFSTAAAAPVASSRLINAVVASLVLGALALCLCVGLTIMTSIATVAQPLVH